MQTFQPNPEATYDLMKKPVVGAGVCKYDSPIGAGEGG